MNRLCCLLLALACALPAWASDHKDSPTIDLMPEADIGDLFLWTGMETGSPCFLINMNPLTDPSNTDTMRLDPSVLYEFKIDLNGDYIADLSYKITVKNVAGTNPQQQEVTLLKATGKDAQADKPLGKVVAHGLTTIYGGQMHIIMGQDSELLFVGPRQDPFFFNFAGVECPVALDLQFALSSDNLPSDGTAANTFGPTNITAIVLEIPELRGKKFNSWSATSVNGAQVDRCGHSSVGAIFLPKAGPGRDTSLYPYWRLKQTYNTTNPNNDVANYGDIFKYRCSQIQVESSRVASVVNFFLPDVLGYDPSQPQVYPNGRNLREDAVYWTIYYLNPFLLQTNTQVQLPLRNPQPISPHFPYACPPIGENGMPLPPDLPRRFRGMK